MKAMADQAFWTEADKAGVQAEEDRCRALELERRYHLSVIKDLRHYVLALEKENERLRKAVKNT
ncbi:hypothetical protein IQ22_01512 [Pseudomonas duriflava]|uniref:Uncharacterized protein n=1 Tax=Pseudomonas duriflava TaxID=459528 RepID=A0A562QHR2_9PSED|nr:hypothetical protein [Pseudomonas duriflava]TWI55586.1 hypothetical protein IQ22_01512 [Pseudomonas duriflava]